MKISLPSKIYIANEKILMLSKEGIRIMLYRRPLVDGHSSQWQSLPNSSHGLPKRLKQ